LKPVGKQTQSSGIIMKRENNNVLLVPSTVAAATEKQKWPKQK
jgi:hypothetical protein